MGVFGQESQHYVGLGVETNGNTGMATFGKPVPMERRERADQHLKDMGLTKTEDRWHCIQEMANAIERDQPMRAMNECFKYLDVTGCYRLMAVLCTDPTPEPANYIDLVAQS